MALSDACARWLLRVVHRTSASQSGQSSGDLLDVRTLVPREALGVDVDCSGNMLPGTNKRPGTPPVCGLQWIEDGKQGFALTDECAQ